MSKSFLFIVEGKVTEKEILIPILNRYGFVTYDYGTINILDKSKEIAITNLCTSNQDKVYIAQGPRNRIRDWLNFFNAKYEDFERYFYDLQGTFAGIFIIYDVDHTSKEDLEKMFNKYNDETSGGLLLLSSPCVEVIADKDRTDDLAVPHLNIYKKELNKKFATSHHCSTKTYIIDHFEELILYYLNKNSIELSSNNVMDHPSLVISKINELNERIFIDAHNQPVNYRYFTTVIYTCIAYIKGLTKEIDNVETVKKYFQSINCS